VEPDRTRDAIIPFGDFLPGVRLVRGSFQSFRPGVVVTDAGEVPFDYLVIATGAGYSGELIRPVAGSAGERRASLRGCAERLRVAGHVLVVGGGPVGVEVAGEILEDLPGTRLTLVHRGDALLPGLTPGPQRYALELLKKRGAEVRLRTDALPDADVVLWCTGSSGGAGKIAVDEHLRVSGHQNVFAVGDVTSLPEPKMGIWAGKHAAVVIENIRSLLRGGAVKARYRPATGSKTMLVTLGRRHGTGHLPFGDFTNSWFARQVKGRDMFIGRYRKGVGLSAG
jgi:NADH dehydrogenase FAD-containing subunit